MSFIPSISFSVEGYSVQLRVCMECGAVVVDDPRDDGALVSLHERWHRQLEEQGDDLDGIIRSGGGA